MMRKTLKATIDPEQEGPIVAKLTTDSVDRDGEVLIPQGMNSKEYENNPVLFYNHDYANPVGTVTNLKRSDKAVIGTLEFARRPEDFQGEFFPAFIEALVKQGVVRGVSVGFIPETNGGRLATKGDRKKWGPRIKRVFNKWKLLEVSIAPLPANQEALIQAVGKGIVSAVQVKSFLDVDLPELRHAVKLRRKPRILLHEPPSAEDEIQKSVARAIARSRGQLYM